MMVLLLVKNSFCLVGNSSVGIRECSFLGIPVVNIGSIVGETGFKHLSGYSATKGALKSLTQCLATEFADRNIRLNVVSPGFTETSYFSNFKKNKKLYDWTLSNIPMARWGKSEEVSAVTAFLISDLSSYITGETINIDGGWIRG